MHNELDSATFSCFAFEVERFNEDDEDTDCNTTAEPAAVDDDNGMDDDEVLIEVKLPKQWGHWSG